MVRGWDCTRPAPERAMHSNWKGLSSTFFSAATRRSANVCDRLSSADDPSPSIMSGKSCKYPSVHRFFAKPSDHRRPNGVGLGSKSKSDFFGVPVPQYWLRHCLRSQISRRPRRQRRQRLLASAPMRAGGSTAEPSLSPAASPTTTRALNFGAWMLSNHVDIASVRRPSPRPRWRLMISAEKYWASLEARKLAKRGYDSAPEEN